MILKPSYAAHEALVAPARAKAQVWRLVLGLIIASGVYLLCNQFLFRNMFTLLGDDADGFFEALQSGATPTAMIILLLSFGFMILGIAVAVRVVHARGVLSVLGDAGSFWRQFRAVLAILVLINIVVWILPPWSWDGEPLQKNMAYSAWFMLLPFSLLAVFIQVSAEEVVFRGYIQQQLAARFASPVVWMLIPAILFGFGHYLPDDAGPNAQTIAVWAVVFGLLMADLTARAGSLGPAIAVHLVNNVTAILLVSLPDELSGLALYLTPFSMEDAEILESWLPVDFAMMLVSWLAARLAIRR
jgi:membrane protease YdiL (CAAX protease family)